MEISDLCNFLFLSLKLIIGIHQKDDRYGVLRIIIAEKLTISKFLIIFLKLFIRKLCGKKRHQKVQ